MLRRFTFCFALASLRTCSCRASSLLEGVIGDFGVILAFAALVLRAGGAAIRAASLVLERVLRAGAVGGTAGGGTLLRLRFFLAGAGLMGIDPTLGISWGSDEHRAAPPSEVA